MGKFKDRSDIPNTCPKIDEISDFLGNVDWDMNDPIERELAQGAERCRELLEEIREANLALRVWGNEKAEELENTERLLEESEEEVGELEDEISRMQRRIEFLEEGEDQW